MRVHVLDNAPFALIGSCGATLRYRVADGPVLDAPMKWSGAQVFRGELPGALAGLVTYWAEATDRYGSSGMNFCRTKLRRGAGRRTRTELPHGQSELDGAGRAPSGLITIAPAELWHFTYWYRDANPGSATNFSNGLTLAFL